MKLAKLSLVAIVVAGLASSAFAASTTLEDAFKNGKVSGDLRAYYFSKTDAKGDNRENLFTTGIILNYKTDTLYGFGANFTAQGNSSPFANEEAKTRFSGDQYGTGAVLSEAYLSYTMSKTTVQVGRMFMDTPLVSSSGSRMTKEAFEGITVVNTDLPDTTLIAGYVQKFQSRTDGKGNVGKFTKSFATATDSVTLDNGAYTFAAINKSVPGLTLTAAYAYLDTEVLDGIHIGYVEALYKAKAGDFGYTLAAQDYYNNFEKSVTGKDDSINTYALKAGLSFKGINGYVAFSQTTDDTLPTGNNILPGLGNGADLLFTDSVISMPGYTKNTDTYAVDLNYDITAAANVGARYVEADYNNDLKASYTSLYASYKFDGALKNFRVGVEFESKGKDADGDQLRFKANYKF